MRILFLCTGNSCRSIMAEAIFNNLAPVGFTAESAGSKPAGYVHPGALAELKKHGVPTDGFSSKGWDTITTKPDIVITLCASAAGEACPIYLGDVLRSHWGIEDPAAVSGAAEQEQAFATTYAILHQRIQRFFELPFTKLRGDKESLIKALDSIGADKEGNE